MQTWLQAVLTLGGAFIASSGFWAFVQKKGTIKDAHTRLLIGLAYDKLMTRGIGYLDRGSISRDELEEYRKYLYEPYLECGGNGIASQIMRQVENLPIRSHNRYSETTGPGGQL